jgi:hypothetical protein
LLKFEGLDVIVVKEIIKALAVNAVLIVPEVFGARGWVDLIEISGPEWAECDGRPGIPDDVLDVGLFHEQDGSRGICYDCSLVTFCLPIS